MNRSAFAASPVETAQRLLGFTLWSGDVGVRIVETEAYGGDVAGPWHDPAAHSARGPTPRSAIMFGEPGRLYMYRSYGIHYCANVTCGPAGVAGAVLIRAGEVVAGHDLAIARRRAAAGIVSQAAPAASVPNLARGPGNLAAALGLTLADYGTDLCDDTAPIRLERGLAAEVRSGPRVGVSLAADRPWRFWVPGSAAVSAYRRSPRAAPAGTDFS